MLVNIQNIPIGEQLRISNPKVNQNFQNLNTELGNVDKKLSDHLNSTTAHKAEDITYSGQVPGTDVKEAIDNVNGRISEIVAQAGDDNTEIVDARGGFTVLGDRLNEITLRLEEVAVNVKKYGALGDGVSDDSPAFEAAIEYVKSVGGGTIYIPPGRYRLLTRIDIDLTLANPVQSGKGINIRGDNPNTTIIINDTESDYAFHAFGRHFTYFHMENLTIYGTDLNGQRGVHMSFLSEQYMENVAFKNLFVGVDMEDVVRCKFVSCTWEMNVNGLYGNNQIEESTPNAIDFFGCVFYGNADTGLYINQGCNINFYGGTIESNGHRFTTAANLRWGARFDDLGRYGRTGCNFFGTYIEGNAGTADIWIQHHIYPATYSFHGCCFNKFAPPHDNGHNIRVDAGDEPGNNAPGKIIVTGCSFSDYGNTPSADTKYIHIYSGGQPIELEEAANFYQNQIEMPNVITNRVYATAKFVNLSTTPALWNGFNISTIFKNGTGDYNIHFIFQSRNAQKISNIQCGQYFVEIVEEDTSKIRIKVFDKNGVATDPPYIMMTCFEG